MRTLICLLMVLLLSGCVATQKATTAPVLHGKEAAEAAAVNLPPSISDLTELKDETYHENYMPWLVDNTTKKIIAKDIFRAIYHPQDRELQVEFMDNNVVVIELYYVKSVTLMTPNGPCLIDDETFTCPE